MDHRSRSHWSIASSPFAEQIFIVPWCVDNDDLPISGNRLPIITLKLPKKEQLPIGIVKIFKS